MEDKSGEKRSAMKRITEIRSEIMERFPFYGSLLLHLKVAFANCGTACTDMDMIYYDLGWIQKLDREELLFLTMHELLHCVLMHPVRGKQKEDFIYNVAADIVVNSHIFHELQYPLDFTIDGEIPMHVSPDGMEGRLQTAEEVYQKILTRRNESSRQESGKSKMGGGDGEIPDSDSLLDRHDIWRTVNESDSIVDKWKVRIEEAAKAAGKNFAPGIFRDVQLDFSHESKVDWRAALRNFLQSSFEEFDYSFLPPDRRFSPVEYGFALPGFFPVETPDIVKDLWLFVDTSGSMADQTLNEIYSEIRYLLEQIEGVRGRLSFFDRVVTDPENFENVSDLVKIRPKGGGGTSFLCIFDYLKKYEKEHGGIFEPEFEAGYPEENSRMPGAVIIITDGYAYLPPEKETGLKVPLLWVLVGTNIKKMAWGECVRVE